MSLAPGDRLGAYEIVEAVGAGGMGEVYRARDTTLERDVAIKVLPEELASDDERVARFEREAKLLAALNHPNIASVHGFESGAIVMELVEGPTLADRIADGPIPVDESLAIARQIAEALEAGHEAGIVHRDLKPANVKLKDDGTVKLLDDGLAKALESDASGAADSELSQSPTLTRQGTQIGVILGTAAYMSPEQAKGKRVDRRADVWAFGAVLYEMLAGRRAFEGEDVSDTLAAVLRAEPDIDALPPAVSPSTRRVLGLCLTKDPRERLRDIGDARLALEGAFDPEEVPQATPAGARPVALWALGTFLVTVGLAALAAWQLRAFDPRPVVRFDHRLSLGQEFLGDSAIAVARDGSQFVYSADSRLFLRRLGETAATPLTAERELASSPVFSPDGAWVAYCEADSRELRKIPVGGGSSVKVALADACYGVDWSEDDSIVFSSLNRVMRVDAGGGLPEQVSGRRMLEPRRLPGGRALTATLWDGPEPRVVAYPMPSGPAAELFLGSGARYVSSGHLVFVRDGALFAVPFDARRLRTTGEAVPLREKVTLRQRVAEFDVSESGTLVYVDPLGAVGSRERVLVLADLEDSEVGMDRLDVPPAEYSSPRIAPDGGSLVVESRDDDGRRTLWVYDLSGERAIRQLTFEGDNHRPVWTPDGERITFASDRDGSVSVYWKPADGSGVAERLTTADHGTQHLPSSWSPDGRWLAYMARTEEERFDYDVWIRSSDGEAEALFVDPVRVHMGPEFSPDGRWIAYHSGEGVNVQDV